MASNIIARTEQKNIIEVLKKLKVIYSKNVIQSRKIKIISKRKHLHYKVLDPVLFFVIFIFADVQDRKAYVKCIYYLLHYVKVTKLN